MANKTIYDLTENQTLDADDLFEQDVLQNNERKSLKVTLRAIADKIITSLTYSSLNTTSKTISGAINELEQGGGGGGTGGHTIKDDDGTSLTQRANLQFKGVYSHDDSTNSASVVEVAREMTWAEYQLLSAAEKKGLIMITDRTGDSNPLLPDYSTTEHKTGRKWIDGKDIWEKTYSDTTPSSATSKNYSMGVSNVDKIIDYNGMVYRNDGAVCKLDHARGDDLIWTMITSSKEFVVNIKDSQYTSQPIYFTIQYTKTS